MLSVVGIGGSAWAATPYPMSSGPYYESCNDITNWTNAFASGIGANRFGSVGVAGTGPAPDATFTSTSTATFTTGSSGGVQRGIGNIVLFVTGTVDNSAAAAIDLFLDCSNFSAGTLSFDWAEIRQWVGQPG